MSSSTIVIEPPRALADDGGFYKEIRKKKKPTRSEIQDIQTRTGAEKRRSAVNEEMDRIKAAEKEASAQKGDPNEQDDDDKDYPNEPDSPYANINAESQAEAKRILEDPNYKGGTEPAEEAKPVSAKGLPRTRSSDSAKNSDSPSVKVNPGTIDEMEFPGPAAENAAPKTAPKIIQKKK